MSKQLPDRPNLEQLRNQAKELLAAARNQDPKALARLQVVPGISARKEKPSLMHAQAALAREHGFQSWPELVKQVEILLADKLTAGEVADKFVRLAVGDSARGLEEILDRRPDLPDYSIQTALVCGNVEKVREWLGGHSCEDELEPLGWRPLEFVVYSRVHLVRSMDSMSLEECARVLLDAGADPNTSHNFQNEDNARLPVLYGACCHSQNERIVRLLLERGAQPNDGESIYHSAQLNLRNMLQLLVEFGGDLSGSDPHWGNTALYFNAGHRVSDTGYERAMLGCEWLLDHGADPNVRSGKCEEAPLFAAIRSGSTRLVRMLLEHGADPTIADVDGQTPYMLAAATGAGDILKLLEQAGADTTLQPGAQFLAACALGDSVKVREQLKSEPNLVTNLGDQAIHSFCRMAELGRIVGVQTCLDAGFPAGGVGPYGGTALHFACYCGWADAASMLIKAGAPLEVRDSTYNAPPLGWALEGLLWNRNPKGDFIRIVRELLAAGASDENLRERLESDDAENPAMVELMEALGEG